MTSSQAAITAKPSSAIGKGKGGRGGRGSIGGRGRRRGQRRLFVPTLTASCGRRNLATTAATEDSTTLGSATARAIRDLVEASPFNASDWLLHELTQFNVKVNMTSFPNESREVIFTTLDTILKLAMTLP